MADEQTTTDNTQRLENRMDEGFRRIWEKLDKFTDVIADLSAAIKNPDPSHCVQRDRLTRVEETQDALKKEVQSQRDIINRVQGGWSVVYWLIGGGFVAIAILIYVLYAVAQHAK